MQIYATVRIEGKEYQVVPGKKVKIDHLDAAPGDVLEFSDVIQLANGERVIDGSPTVKGALVRATLVKHGQISGEIVFKMNRRRKYRYKRDRQWSYSVLRIDDVALGNNVFSRRDLDPRKLKKAQAAQQKKTRSARVTNKPAVPPPAPAPLPVEEKPRVAEPPPVPGHEAVRDKKKSMWPVVIVLLLGLAALLWFLLNRDPVGDGATVAGAAPEQADITLRQTGEVDRPVNPKQPPR